MNIKPTRLLARQLVTDKAEVSLQANAKGKRLYLSTAIKRYLFPLWEVVGGPLKSMLMRSHAWVALSTYFAAFDKIAVSKRSTWYTAHMSGEPLPSKGKFLLRKKCQNPVIPGCPKDSCSPNRSPGQPMAQNTRDNASAAAFASWAILHMVRIHAKFGSPCLNFSILDFPRQLLSNMNANDRWSVISANGLPYRKWPTS